jgi:hypothetical protein
MTHTTEGLSWWIKITNQSYDHNFLRAIVDHEIQLNAHEIMALELIHVRRIDEFYRVVHSASIGELQLIHAYAVLMDFFPDNASYWTDGTFEHSGVCTLNDHENCTLAVLRHCDAVEGALNYFTEEGFLRFVNMLKTRMPDTLRVKICLRLAETVYRSDTGRMRLITKTWPEVVDTYVDYLQTVARNVFDNLLKVPHMKNIREYLTDTGKRKFDDLINHKD